MLQMLPKVIRTEELFGRIAFPEFVGMLQMLESFVPVFLGRPPSVISSGANRPA